MIASNQADRRTSGAAEDEILGDGEAGAFVQIDIAAENCRHAGVRVGRGTVDGQFSQACFRQRAAAGRIADEVITHLVGLVGSSVRVTLEIDAQIPEGASDTVVRTVTENSRTLKFASNSGFETE